MFGLVDPDFALSDSDDDDDLDEETREEALEVLQQHASASEAKKVFSPGVWNVNTVRSLIFSMVLYS